MNPAVRKIKSRGKKVCQTLFPRQMEFREIRKQSIAWEERRQWFENLDEFELAQEVAKQYKEVTGLELNLADPKRFTEKIQWRKLYDRNPIYSQLADKYAVREWVAKKIGEEHLIPLLGVWDSADEIDFDSLPDSFVLKTNNGSGTNIIVRNKAELDIPLTRKKLNAWLERPFYCASFELHYRGIRPRILAEQFIGDVDERKDLPDFKFFCFNGEPEFCWVDLDRFHGHKRKVYNMNWEPQDWRYGPHGERNGLPKPEHFEEMKELARALSKGFAHVRVDFYDTCGKVYFGEMTFTSASGYEVFSEDDLDFKYGAMWDLNVPQTDEDIVKA